MYRQPTGGTTRTHITFCNEFGLFHLSSYQAGVNLFIVEISWKFFESLQKYAVESLEPESHGEIWTEWLDNGKGKWEIMQIIGSGKLWESDLARDKCQKLLTNLSSGQNKIQTCAAYNDCNIVLCDFERVVSPIYDGIKSLRVVNSFTHLPLSFILYYLSFFFFIRFLALFFFLLLHIFHIRRSGFLIASRNMYQLNVRFSFVLFFICVCVCVCAWGKGMIFVQAVHREKSWSCLCTQQSFCRKEMSLVIISVNTITANDFSELPR